MGIRHIALTQHNSKIMLVLEDPGGEPLGKLLGRPMELTEFLRFGGPLGLRTIPCTTISSVDTAREVVDQALWNPLSIRDERKLQSWRSCGRYRIPAT
jgi:hypothetical protein